MAAHFGGNPVVGGYPGYPEGGNDWPVATVVWTKPFLSLKNKIANEEEKITKQIEFFQNYKS